MLVETELLSNYEKGSFFVKAKKPKKWFEFWRSEYNLITGYYIRIGKNVNISIKGLKETQLLISTLPFKPISNITVYIYGDETSINYTI